MSVVLFELRDTTAVRWRRELTGPHRATKVSYYRAVESLLARDAGLSWRDIVDEVRPRGSRTTFFAVAGPHAKHPLAGAYRAGPAREVAALLDRPAVPEMLIDEAKVASYWPHRDGWLSELARADGVSRAVIAECLVRVLLDWAAARPQLAVALDCAPPACAVEDLVVIRDGRITVAEAARLLREAIRLRLLAEHAVDGVLRALRPLMRPQLPVAAGNCGLARAIDQLARATDDQRRLAVEIMRDAIDHLTRPELLADVA